MNIKQCLNIVLVVLITLSTSVCNDARAVNPNLTTGIDCATIQECVDKANSGDTILIAAGNYLENLTLDKDLILQGSGEAITIIDGQATTSVVTINNQTTVTIANIAITNGIIGIRNEGILTLNYCTINSNISGGISNWHDDSVLTISNCTIKDNSVIGVGGGIYNGGGKLIITNSIIEGNSATSSGGGIFAQTKSSVVLENTIVSNNIGDIGGGIYHDADNFKLINSSVTKNIANQGGGIYNDHHTQTKLENTVIKNNSATSGGGIYNFTENKVTLVNSIIKNNTASEDGGGIYNGGDGVYGNEVSLKSSSVISNVANRNGSGIFNEVHSTVELINSTINDNEGSGVYNNGELILHDENKSKNNIIDIDNLGTVTLAHKETNSDSSGEIGDDEDILILHNSNTSHNDETATHSEKITTLVKSDNGSSYSINVDDINVVDLQKTNTNVISESTITNLNNDRFIPTLIYVSSSSSGKIGNLSFGKEDILVYNLSTKTWSLYFDGSDVGLSAANLNAFHIQNDGSLLLSFQEPNFAISGFDTVSASDIVSFRPTNLGETTQGSFEWYFDGSDVGLSSAEGIDAIAFTSEGDLLVSIIIGFEAQDIDGADKDLLMFKASSLGQSTSGTWSLYFDGSDVNLDGPTEDIYGAWLNPDNGDLYLTTLGGFSLPEFSGDTDDIFTFTPTTLGDNTSGSFGIFWDGDLNGFTNEWIDGLFLR